MFSSLDFTAKSSFFFPKVSWLSSLKETRRIEIERLQTQGQAPGFRGKICGIFWCQQKTTGVKNLKQRFVDLIFLLKKERNNYYMLDLQGWSMMFEVWFVIFWSWSPMSFPFCREDLGGRYFDDGFPDKVFAEEKNKLFCFCNGCSSNFRFARLTTYWYVTRHKQKSSIGFMLFGEKVSRGPVGFCGSSRHDGWGAGQATPARPPRRIRSCTQTGRGCLI